jgi:hypothetical protein
MKAEQFLALKDAVSTSHMKEEVERQYRRLFCEVPVDRLLCRPHLAIGFAAVVRDRLGIFHEDVPDSAILETLINLRKRGVIKTEVRGT